MNRDPTSIALYNALTEIKKAYPGIHHSFLFTNNGSIVTGDPETDDETVKNVLESFEDLKEKAKAIGNLKSFSINAKNGKIVLSSIEDMYLILATSEKIDDTQIYSITHVIIPIILKTMKTFTQPNLQSQSTKKLVVDTLGGFFAGDSVQIDIETLMDWTQNSDPRARVKAALTGEQIPQESIDQVEIETFGGNSIMCKVKEISDQKLKGKNMIRIPEKLCDTLEIRKGDLVKVKPMV